MQDRSAAGSAGRLPRGTRQGRPQPHPPVSVVLAHGYHVQAQQWRDVVWGDPHDNHLGRVPRAVLTALEQPNPLLLFGTGAPAGDGVLESELTLHFARDHRSDLYDLASESLAISRERSRLLVDDLLDQRSLCERTSTTTRTEVAAALQTSLQHRAHRLTLVSSPPTSPDACKAPSRCWRTPRATDVWPAGSAPWPPTPPSPAAALVTSSSWSRRPDRTRALWTSPTLLAQCCRCWAGRLQSATSMSGPSSRRPGWPGPARRTRGPHGQPAVRGRVVTPRARTSKT